MPWAIFFAICILREISGIMTSSLGLGEIFKKCSKEPRDINSVTICREPGLVQTPRKIRGIKK